jgi:PAS domain S-box-containing protein
MANSGRGFRDWSRDFSGRDALVVAVLVTFVTGALAFVFHIAFPRDGFLFLYMPVIGAVAYLWGPWPGGVAGAISLVTAWFFIIPPAYSFALSVESVPILVLFALIAGLVVDGARRLRNAEAASHQFALIVRSSDDAIFSKSLDGVIQTWNRGAERLYGYSAAEAIGRSVAMLIPPDRVDEQADLMARLRRGEYVEHHETTRMRKDGAPVDLNLSLSPILDAVGRIVGASEISRDITERKQIETKRRQSQEQDQVLNVVAAAIGGLTDLQQMLRILLDHLRPVVRFTGGSIILREGDELVVRAAEGPFAAEALTKRLPRGVGRVWQVLDCGEPFLSGDLLAEGLAPTTPLRSYLAVPLFQSGRPFGVLEIDSTEPRAFEAVDLAFMQRVALVLSGWIELALRYAQERHVATTLQHALLPTALPEVPGVRIDAVYRAAGPDAEVGGDWFDAFALPGGRLVLTVGDVAGRGLDAAVLMGEMRHAIRATALAGHDPAKALQVANSIARADARRMVTAMVAILDPVTLLCTYAAAGHPAPVLATPKGVERLEQGTFPLGVRDGLPIEVESLRLPAEALLVFYTDGLIEFDRDIISGEAALQAAVADQYTHRLSHPAGAILEQVLSGRPARDDIAILTAGIDRLLTT